jgi:hypothetical protein
MIPDLERRLSANLDAIIGEITAPRRSRLERVLLRLRVPEPAARLMAATPVLRWGWLAAMLVVLMLAASAGSQAWEHGDQLAFFLAIAPLVPVASVALAYGPHADRAHEVGVAAPLSGLRLLLLRTIVVVTGAAGISVLAVLTAPTEGVLRLAWLAPSLATTAITLAVGARVGLARAATWVSVVWLLLVLVCAQVTDDAIVAFRWPAQVVAAAIAIGAFVALLRSRHELERWSSS